MAARLDGNRLTSMMERHCRLPGSGGASFWRGHDRSLCRGCGLSGRQQAFGGVRGENAAVDVKEGFLVTPVFNFLTQTATRQSDVLLRFAASGEEHGAHEELGLRVAVDHYGGGPPQVEGLDVLGFGLGEPRGVVGGVETEFPAPLVRLRRAHVWAGGGGRRRREGGLEARLLRGVSFTIQRHRHVIRALRYRDSTCVKTRQGSYIRRTARGKGKRTEESGV